MKILIAEDEPLSRRLLEINLKEWGFEVIVVGDGMQAWDLLQDADAPSLAIFDVMMPGLDGLELCRRLRQLTRPTQFYLILLTAKATPSDVVAGLQAGADDYLTKPFNREELRARVQVGRRVIDLQERLTQRVYELEEVLQSINQLQNLLPICSYCKRIRDDQNYWQQLDDYVTRHSSTRFSHSVCPECYEHVAKPELEKWKQRKRAEQEQSFRE